MYFTSQLLYCEGNDPPSTELSFRARHNCCYRSLVYTLEVYSNYPFPSQTSKQVVKQQCCPSIAASCPKIAASQLPAHHRGKGSKVRLGQSKARLY